MLRRKAIVGSGFFISLLAVQGNPNPGRQLRNRGESCCLGSDFRDDLLRRVYPNLYHSILLSV